MKEPKWTDLHKRPHGYRRAVDTNVAETFERVKREQERNAAERADKVAKIRIKGKV